MRLWEIVQRKVLGRVESLQDEERARPCSGGLCGEQERPAKEAKTSRHSSSSTAPSGPSTFVEELVEPVLARLPLSQLTELKQESKL